jgi:acyl carrier protein
MSESIRQRVAYLMEQVLSMPIASQSDIRRADLPSWDSLNHLRIVLAVEEEFNLHLTPEEVTGLASLADFVRLIEAKQ